MTTEQINIAIAQACGWTDTEIVNEGGKLMYGQTQVRNYCGNLNDMWAAETHLTPDQQVEFVYQLSEIVAPITGDTWMLIHASAFARAKAFLRTVGKWERALDRRP